MLSFDNFLQTEGMPIYLQIIRYIKQGLVAGTVQDGEELPSRRVLSALLAVNPNTIQKAYRILEEDGLVVSRSGAKSYIAADQTQIHQVRSELLEGDMRQMAGAMKQMGLTREAAHRLLDQLFCEEENT